MNNRKHIKVTYSTLGSPDPLLHAYYEDALLTTAHAGLGQTHRLLINGAWGATAHHLHDLQPDQHECGDGTFSGGRDAGDIDRAVQAAVRLSLLGAPRPGGIASRCCARWPRSSANACSTSPR